MCILDSSFNDEALGFFRNFKRSNDFIHFILFLRCKFYILHCLVYKVLYIVFIVRFTVNALQKKYIKQGALGYRYLNCTKTLQFDNKIVYQSCIF